MKRASQIEDYCYRKNAEVLDLVWQSVLTWGCCWPLESALAAPAGETWIKTKNNNINSHIHSWGGSKLFESNGYSLGSATKQMKQRLCPGCEMCKGIQTQSIAKSRTLDILTCATLQKAELVFDHFMPNSVGLIAQFGNPEGLWDSIRSLAWVA